MNIELNNIYGDFPNEPCIFAACDSKYFMEHASPFINSSTLSGKVVHIHVVNPTDECIAEANRLKELASSPVSYTYNDLDMPNDPDQMKCIYACLRFFILPHLLERVEKVMILDIDCVILKSFGFPNKPCGLFVKEPVTYLDEWTEKGTMINASSVYFHRSYIDKAKKLVEIINSLPRVWLVDQVALYILLTKHIKTEDLIVFNGNFMDWNFFEGTAIWTGKGKSKTDNPRYVAMKQRMTV